MKKTSNSGSDFLSVILLIVAGFMCLGWYCAEADNELLQQELEAQHYTKPVHNLDHEDK